MLSRDEYYKAINEYAVQCERLSVADSYKKASDLHDKLMNFYDEVTKEKKGMTGRDLILDLITKEGIDIDKPIRFEYPCEGVTCTADVSKIKEDDKFIVLEGV